MKSAKYIFNSNVLDTQTIFIIYFLNVYFWKLLSFEIVSNTCYFSSISTLREFGLKMTYFVYFMTNYHSNLEEGARKENLVALKWILIF